MLSSYIHGVMMKGESMGYINAKDVLPKALIDEIQHYVQGVNLYIPNILKERNTEHPYQRELRERNEEIYARFRSGTKVSELAKAYYLSDKSIYRIIGQMKKQ
jgi:Mor family transcriptional regulator